MPSPAFMRQAGTRRCPEPRGHTVPFRHPPTDQSEDIPAPTAGDMAVPLDASPEEAPPEPLPRFYSVAELAEIFGRSRRSIRGWLQSGKLPCVRIGNARFVAAETIENPRSGRGNERAIPIGYQE